MTENDENSNRVFPHRFRELEVPTISVRYLRNRCIETGDFSSTRQTILKKIFFRNEIRKKSADDIPKILQIFRKIVFEEFLILT